MGAVTARRVLVVAVLAATLAALLPARVAFATTTAVRIDMQDCDGDVVPPIDESTWTDVAVASVVGSVHQVCASGFDAQGARVTASMTFTITDGPGVFTNTSGTADLGRQISVDPGATHNVVYVRSVVTGTSAITAAQAGVSDNGWKPWVAGAARTIVLGSPSGTNGSASRQIFARVLDEFGNGVPGRTVTFSETGTGRLDTPAEVVTDSLGRAAATVARAPGETGSQTLTASIDPTATDCDRAANDPAGAPAGVCAASVTLQWQSSSTTLTIAARPTGGVWGTEFVIEGFLVADGAAVPGAAISVEKREGTTGPFVPLSFTSTDASGHWLATDVAKANAQYRAIYTGDADHEPASSAIARIWVRTGVWFSAVPSVARVGSPTTLSGRVLPEHPGLRVLLQQYSPQSGWKTIATTTADRRSNFSFKVAKRSAGWILFRAVSSTHYDHLWNVSVNRRVDWR